MVYKGLSWFSAVASFIGLQSFSFPVYSLPCCWSYFFKPKQELHLCSVRILWCGCTVANFTKTPIEPGKTGEVSVTYNGKGKLFGPFKKTITIRSNAKPTIARLSIAGNMLEEAEEK